MGINIPQTMNSYQFENGEHLRNTARNILSRTGVSNEESENILETTIFGSRDSRIYSDAQLSILKASSQIILNNPLKETSKYIKNNTSKKPVLGELWKIFENDENSEIDILDLEIDYSAENIFAAA